MKLSSLPLSVFTRGRIPRHFSTLALLLLSLALPPVASAASPNARGALANLDRRQAPASRPANPQKEAAVAALRARIPQLQVERDPVLDEPRFIASPSRFLTGANGEGGAVSPATASQFAAGDSLRGVKALLREHQALFGFGPEALDQAKVQRDYLSKAGGFRTLVWAQELDEIPVFEAFFKTHLSSRGEVINVSSQLVPHLDQAANQLRGRAALESAPPISAQQAIILAGANIGDTVATNQITTTDTPQGKALRQHGKAFPVLNRADVHLTWLPMDDTTVRLCWEVLLTSRARGETFSVLVDAQNGEVLVRHCLTAYLSTAQYNVFTGDSPSPMSPGWSTPNTNQPALVSRSLVTLSALNTTASPNGWINDGDNTTVGNNVDAHLDWDNDNVPDPGSRPVGSPFRVFNFPLDLTAAPTTYTNASVVQLFYWNNWMHDQLYSYGFDEASGNFQFDNFGRGGVGGDPVQADCQDASLANLGGYPNPGPGGPANYNNANFSTLPDGETPRMQMYLYQYPSPKRDGSLDAETVCHEYTHGLSSRLVGGGFGITAWQTAGMGEGWSDFVALSLLSKSADDPNGVYPFSAYLGYNMGGKGFNQNYYFGFRRYPYCTDLAKNPLTFKDIDPGQASTHAGVPLNPLFSSVYANDAGEVHSMGEVWCATLWDARARLMASLGNSTGNQEMLQLVVDGMKLAPGNPNFLQARDAILQADLALTGGANLADLWAAFARRGMGYSATSPNSVTNVGVVESFDLPAANYVTTMTTPSERQVCASAPTASGTCNIGSRGVVRLLLQRESDGSWYNPTTHSWGPGPVTGSNLIFATGSANWTATLPSLNEGLYYLEAQCIDTNNSAISAWSSHDFIIDPVPPTVGFSPLTNQQTVLDFSKLGGPVNKPATVSFRITEYNVAGTNRYWDGSTWTYNDRTNSIWLATTVNGNTWTPAATLPGRTQTRYGHYLVDVTAYDGPGLSASSQIVVIRSATDTNPPAVTIDSLTANQVVTNNYLPGLFGTATDPNTGVSQVSVYLMRLDSGNFLYWSGSGWTTSPTSLSAGYDATSGQWQVTALPSGDNLPNGTYQAQVYAQNSETPPATQGVSVSFTVDYHPVYLWTEGSYTDGIQGNENHNWDNPANWSPYGVPTPDAVVIINGGTCDSTTVGTLQIYKVQLAGGTLVTPGMLIQKLDFSSGAISGGAVNLGGATNAVGNWTGGNFSGTIGVLTGATLNISPSSSVTLGSGAILNNGGTVNWSGPGPIYNYAYYGDSHATINNQSNAVFNLLTNGQVFSHDYNESTFNNQAGARFVSSTGSNFINNFIFNNQGQIQAGGGTLVFNDQLNLQDGGSVSGTGLCQFASGNLTLQGTTLLNGATFQMLSGQLTGNSGSVLQTSNGGLLDWQGGYLAGVVEIGAGAQFAISSAATKTMSSGAYLRNRGTVTWRDGGSLYNYGYYGDNRATIDNFGTFQILGDAAFTYDYSASFVTNRAGATFTKSGGSGTTRLDWSFNNDGQAQVTSGTLALNGGGTSSGSFSVGAGAFVTFTGGTQTLNDGVTLAGAGHFQVNGGTLTRNGTISAAPSAILDILSGTFDGTGTLAQTYVVNWTGGTIGGQLTAGPAVVFNATGNGTKTLGGSARFNNAGTFNWSGTGSLYTYAYFGDQVSTFNNLSNAVFALQSDGEVFTIDYNRCWFTNQPGALFVKRAGAGTNTIDRFQFENYGEVRAETGSLNFTDLLELWDGSRLTGPATVRFDGTVNLQGTLHCSGNLVLEAGSLTGAWTTNATAGGTFSGTGSFSWIGGTLGGDFGLAAGSTLNILGSNTKSLGSGAVFDNYGTVTWNGPGTIYNTAYYGSQVATFNNRSNAVFALQDDGNVFTSDYNRSYFTNFPGAVLAKTVGTGTNFLGAFGFENNGELRAQTGAMAFTTYLGLNTGSRLTGAGAIRFASDVRLNATINAACATFLDSGTLTGTVDSNAVYSGTGPLTWLGGAFAGTMTLQSGSTLNLSGANEKAMNGYSIRNNAGTINWSGPGRLHNYGYNGAGIATINNQPGASFNLQTDGQVFINDYNRSVFNNQAGAHFAKLGGSGTNWVDFFAFNQYGEARAQSGTVAFDDLLDVYPGSTFTGRGTHLLSAGTTTLHGATTINGSALSLAGATLVGDTSTNTPVLSTANSGVFDWAGGTLAGTVTLATGSSNTISGAATKFFGSGAVLNNLGNLTWSGSGNIHNYAYYGGQQATFNNQPGATFTCVSDAAMDHEYNASTFNNAGTFRKVVTTGTTSCDWIFNNAGQLDLQSGQVSINNNGLNLSNSTTVTLLLDLSTNQAARLAYNGALALGGTLQLQLANGLVPTNGLSFNLVGYSSESGQFSPTQLPALPKASAWKLTYGANVLTAQVVPATVIKNLGFAAGAFQFSITGPSGTSCLVETSTNLVNWVPVLTNAPFNGTLNFTEPLPLGSPHRFFRAQMAP